MKTKKITLFLFALAAGLYLYKQQGLMLPETPEPSPSPIVIENTQEEINFELVLTATKSGQTALELLDTGAKIETKDFGDAGMFVTSIDDVASDNENYWAFYVNDEYAQQGVSQTILDSGDVVKFIYEEISQAKL